MCRQRHGHATRNIDGRVCAIALSRVRRSIDPAGTLATRAALSRYRASASVVLPSLIDNLPNSCLEAMGLGRVVIGTKGTSFEELITDEANGFLIEQIGS